MPSSNSRTIGVEVGMTQTGSATGKGKASLQTGAGSLAVNYEVDPLWPKPLPEGWVIGQCPGVAIDEFDNIDMIFILIF